MKRREMSDLAGLMKLEWIREEIEKEKSLERWARRCSNNFPKKTKRLLFQEVDNMIWNKSEREVAQWCKRNKVFDEITEKEMMEIWMRDEPDAEEPVRLNGKYVWETAKRVCEFINTHQDLITITTFGEYRVVMKKVMNVIEEAHSIERKRRLFRERRGVKKQDQEHNERRHCLPKSKKEK